MDYNRPGVLNTQAVNVYTEAVLSQSSFTLKYLRRPKSAMDNKCLERLILIN